MAKEERAQAKGSTGDERGLSLGQGKKMALQRDIPRSKLVMFQTIPKEKLVTIKKYRAKLCLQ